MPDRRPHTWAFGVIFALLPEPAGPSEARMHRAWRTNVRDRGKTKRRAGPPGSGGLQQLARVSPCRPIVLVRTEHPHELADHAIALERCDRRHGRRPRAVLDDREVPVG